MDLLIHFTQKANVQRDILAVSKPRTKDTPVKKMTIVALGAAALVAAACGKKEQVAGPPPEVYVADVVQKDVPVYMELVGQTKGSQDVEIRARVEGYLETVNFTEGTFVTQGAPLYQIDPKPLEADLARAKAELATAEARLAKNNNDVPRLAPLAKQQAVSQQELDNALAAQDAARAQVDAQRAAVDNATLNLGYAHINSPIDGLVGTTNVKPGNLVGRGESTLLTTVSQVEPILFRAGVSEADYLRLARRRDELKQTSAASPSIELVLADGTVHPEKGTLDAVERAVDPTTGTLAIQVRFPNPGHLIRPGQYGRIRFQSDLKKDALLVPQRAVAELQNLYSVAVVGADNTASFRNVKVGPRVDTLWVIEDGLKPGERVVVEGLQRVRDGAPVSPKPVSSAPAGSGAADTAAQPQAK
jgi:membrane fusion protein, multidrug efflux system